MFSLKLTSLLSLSGVFFLDFVHVFIFLKPHEDTLPLFVINNTQTHLQ